MSIYIYIHMNVCISIYLCIYIYIYKMSLISKTQQSWCLTQLGTQSNIPEDPISGHGCGLSLGDLCPLSAGDLATLSNQPW